MTAQRLPVGPALLGLAALAMAEALLLPSGSPIRAVFGALFVLVVPGFAITRAALGRSRLDPLMVAILTLALSLAATIAVGLALAVLGVRLDRTGLTLGLAALTAVAGGIAAWRVRESWQLPALRIDWGWPVAALLVVAVFAGCLSYLARPLPDRGVAPYSLLGATRAGAAGLKVTVLNGAQTTRAWRVAVLIGHQQIAAEVVTLKPGARWTGLLAPGVGERPAIVRLFPGADGVKPEREIYLRT